MYDGDIPVHNVDGGTLVDVSKYDPLDHNLTGLDVLHQAERWRDADGNVHRLEAMTPSHRRHLLAFLRRRADRLQFSDAMLALSGPFAARGEMAQDAEGDYFEACAEDPLGWLNETPLVRRLAELVTVDNDAEARRAATEVDY